MRIVETNTLGMDTKVAVEKAADDVLENIMEDCPNTSEHFWLKIRTDQELDKQVLQTLLTQRLYEATLPWRILDVVMGIDHETGYFYNCLFDLTDLTNWWKC